jgi:hypothetical protein
MRHLGSGGFWAIIFGIRLWFEEMAPFLGQVKYMIDDLDDLIACKNDWISCEAGVRSMEETSSQQIRFMDKHTFTKPVVSVFIRSETIKQSPAGNCSCLRHASINLKVAALGRLAGSAVMSLGFRGFSGPTELYMVSSGSPLLSKFHRDSTGL